MALHPQAKNAKGALLKFEVVRRPSAPRPGKGGVVGDVRPARALSFRVCGESKCMMSCFIH